MTKSISFLGTANSFIRSGIQASLVRTYASLGHSEADVLELQKQLSTLNTQELVESVQLMSAYVQSQILEQCTKEALKQQREAKKQTLAMNRLITVFSDKQ